MTFARSGRKVRALRGRLFWSSQMFSAGGAVEHARYVTRSLRRWARRLSSPTSSIRIGTGGAKPETRGGIVKQLLSYPSRFFRRMDPTSWRSLPAGARPGTLPRGSCTTIGPQIDLIT